jgi:hypothetical protein
MRRKFKANKTREKRRETTQNFLNFEKKRAFFWMKHMRTGKYRERFFQRVEFCICCGKRREYRKKNTKKRGGKKIDKARREQYKI